MIKLVCVGKIKEKAMQSMLDEYLKRLSAYTKIKICEVEDVMAPQKNSDAQNEEVKMKEGERILSQIHSDEFVILLDLHGKMLDSVAFSQYLEKLRTYGKSDLTFVIGGSLGLSGHVIKRADFRWKLSDLTFTHQMTRLLCLEQIYRAYKIENNEPYHK